MTLYCWIHWFWITFTLCIRWFLFLCAYFSLHLKSTTATHLNMKLDQNYSELLASVNNLPDVNTNLPSSNFLSNQTDKTNKTELLHFGLHKVSAAALPKNETNVIDKSSNNTNENIFGTNTTVVNISCSICNETKNSSSIENYNFRQSLVVNSNYSRINKQNETSVSSLSAAGITGISLGCLSFMLIITVVAFVAYRNLGFNRPQVLNDRCSNPDSSGYIDDSTMRENSEEMYSLDNDSFLNSLEAMTIQNLWTDTVKHTKL